MSKKLTRNKSNALLGGVCSGIGDYFDKDPVLIRLLWLMAIFFFGTGLLLYIIAWVIIPEE